MLCQENLSLDCAKPWLTSDRNLIQHLFGQRSYLAVIDTEVDAHWALVYAAAMNLTSITAAAASIVEVRIDGYTEEIKAPLAAHPII
jgi:hypothetical protein